STPPDRILPECGTTTLCACASRVMESSRITTSLPCSTNRFAFSITMSATCTRRCDDQAALPFADRRDDVDDAHAQVAARRLEAQALIGIPRTQVVERDT